MSQHLAIAITGRKHTGKSTLAEKIARSMKLGKVVIIDPNNSPAYAKHPFVSFKKLCSLKSGIVRYYETDTNLMFANLMEMLSKKRFNGLIVFEDATKYIDAKPTQIQKAVLVDHRMWNSSLIFTFHAIEFVPRFFWKMLTHVVILKTQDMMQENYTTYAKRIPNFRAIYAAWNKVMKSNNEFENITIGTLI